MKRSPSLALFRRAALCASLVLLAACNPIDVIRWAPDGQHALVQTATGGSFIVDATGAIVADGHGMQLWMPDSQRTLEVHTVPARDWAEYAGVLGPDRAADVAEAAEALLPDLKSFTGPRDNFGTDPATRHWVAVHPAVSLESAIYYLAKQHAKAIAGTLTRWSKEPHEHGSDPASISIYELILQEALPQGPPKPQTLLPSADPIPFVRPSPKGAAIAFARSRPDQDSLELISSEGGKPQLVADGAGQADWTSDGQRLVFFRHNMLSKTQREIILLGNLERRWVCAADGHILTVPEAVEVLAVTLSTGSTDRVACLPDGRILFNAPVIKFPSLLNDQPEVTLFTLKAGASAKLETLLNGAKSPPPVDATTMERVLSPEAQKKLPNQIESFVLSPDGRRVAIPGAHGEIAVVSLENGEITTLQDKAWDFDSSAKFLNTARLSCVMPSWRTADELCYVAPMPDRDGQPQRAEMVLRKLGAEPRPISQRWSDAATDAFLPREKPAEKK